MGERAFLRALPAAALAMAVASNGCATRAFDRHIEAGEYGAALRLFEADSSLQRDEHALFRIGLASATPGAAAYRPDRARELLERLLALHPGSSYDADARRTLALLHAVDRAERRIAERDAELRSLEARAAELRERLDWLQASLQREERLTDMLRQVVERLEADLRDREIRLRALQEELERLKAIDLQRPRSGGRTGER